MPMKSMQKKEFFILLAVLMLAVVSRWVPHPPNFSPVASLALFSGLFFTDKRLAFGLPLAVMLICDLFLGLHAVLPFVYFGFICTVGFGFLLRNRFRLTSMALAVLGSSVLFFLVTNFGVWLVTDMYPATPAGLMACYTAAIPFFQNSVLGNLFFSLIFLGGYALARRTAGIAPRTAL